MPHSIEPRQHNKARFRWQLQLKTIFLLTAGIAALCWLAINFRWLGSQVSFVQTATTILESNLPNQPGGIVVLKPRRVASRGLHPMLPGNLRWIAIWAVIGLGGTLWWRRWRQTRAIATTATTGHAVPFETDGGPEDAVRQPADRRSATQR